ncbi:MAG TPA: alkyl hydroperoxide reductase [Chloroflexota bacterium]|nr:alkyl hydroperoxide reductase [Chloroflexota bacterium]
MSGVASGMVGLGVSAARVEMRTPVLVAYRPWLRAAAVYNLVWGSGVVLFPHFLFDALGLAVPAPAAIWQVVGMFVLVYAPAYWWASGDPVRHRHLLLVGLAGKTLGPLGYVWAAVSGALPVEFGWIVLANDLVWWPALAACVHQTSRASGGWSRFVRGD